jgi:DNA-binding beta-propeller fold protein YncE
MRIHRWFPATAGLVLLAAAVFAMIGWRQSSAASPGVAAKVAVPKFAVDPSWPHIPNGWTLGQVSSAATDSQGNIWIIHRPRTVKPGVKTGPPVMEFDSAGNYVRGWEGESGEGYTWPSTEHGITVDFKGNVWISGNGDDDQVLKFTADGKFLMQVGRAAKKKSNADTTSLWRPADVYVYPKTNELFVADGYGNKRVIVFDADTGAYKRMWGAFGNVPLDDPPRPPALTGEAAKAAAEQAEANRTLATGFDPKDPGPSQFVPPVHGVKVSSDGLVYVADRGGKRVQIFTTAGKYIAQVWIDRWCLVAGGGCNNGNTAASVAFSADPGQRFLYVASRSPARIWVFDRRTLRALDSFGRPGIAPGEFDVLHHMTTDNKGNLYTSEVEDGRRIQKFVFRGLVMTPVPDNLGE